FALVVFAPLLQQYGGRLLATAMLVITAPLALILSVVLGDVLTTSLSDSSRKPVRILLTLLSMGLMGWSIYALGMRLYGLEILSGRNALNVSIILGIMALPTVVSVSEDALSAVGREMREGSYALGATRAETLLKVVIPAASSGILAAILLGIMRAFGETMVVWMAAGNASEIPKPWYNLLSPVRTLTATIAGDMGETARNTAHYHCLFLMGLALLTFSFISNLISEWAVRHQRRKLG
ncbi:MAG: PstC family ABC transporter permease, partial [Candidatus Sumerlaeota bacterium]